MSIRVPYVEGTSEPKGTSKRKDALATDDKIIIFYKIDFSNCEAVYFSKSKRSLKSLSDERKRSVKSYDSEENEIERQCIGSRSQL